MNLVKALRMEKRTIQKIDRLKRTIQNENSLPLENERKIEIDNLMIKLKNISEFLIKLQLSISEASRPKKEHILRIDMLKSRISFLESLDVREGKVPLGNKFVEYKAMFDKHYVQIEIGNSEEKLTFLQDELDEFYHDTEIEVEICS